MYGELVYLNQLTTEWNKELSIAVKSPEGAADRPTVIAIDLSHEVHYQ